MNKFQSLVRTVLVACVTVGVGGIITAQAAILNVPLLVPKVSATGGGGTCSYDAGSSTLTITGIPDTVAFDSAETNIGFVDLGALTISANIDSTGTLVSGTFTMNGETTDFNTSDFFGSPLLTGTITAYGIDAPGTSDKVDFIIQPTGGSLLARFAAGDQIAAAVTLEGSTYAGSFASSWSCTTPKTNVGSTPPLVPPVEETCALSLTKTANPTTVGPIEDRPGHDKFGDSDDDDDDNGYGYSRDDDDGSIYCGCRGKVSELTLHYNGTSDAHVKVTRNAPYSVGLYEGTVQPGSEFTVSGNSYGPRGFAGTLGSSIEIAVDGGEAVDMETSGAKPIGPGLVAGDFEVVSGKSSRLHKPLCPVPPNSCPANQQVTYTYVLSNGGSALANVSLDDDKLGNILTGGTLAGGQSATFTKTACLSHTTTNVATATGELPSGAHCAAPSASATVTLIMPPPDCNKHQHDCDPEDTPPPPPPGHGGCSNGYWKDHGKKWGKSFKNGDRFGAIFQVDSAGNRSLIDSLDIDGGSSKALGREAVAALLNASNPDVHYLYTPAQVKAMVKGAYDTKDFKTATDQLKQQNNCGCPLGN